MSDDLGRARQLHESELRSTEEIGERGIYLGHFLEDPKKLAGDAIHYSGDRHVLVLGPTGSGKTKRFLVQNLTLGLEDRSVIVIDPKGELAAMTAGHRRSLGHRVVVLNPFDVLGLESSGFNPMSALDPDAPSFFDDAAALADALIKVEGKEPHWSESAQGLMIALLMWEKKLSGDSANLANVRHRLTEAADRDEDGRLIAGLRATATKMTVAGDDVIASLAARFAREGDEIRSIQSTADTQTRWLLSKQMADHIKKDELRFGDLKDTPTTVYVVLPAERLRTHSVWLRLVIVSALRSLYRPGKVKTALLIDEMAALGHLGPLEDAFGLVRGFGIQIAGIFQDLPQLKALYNERWETFVANAGAVWAFAPNDLTTAEWMSKRAGQTTVVVRGLSQSSGTSTAERGTTSSEGMGSSDQQMARPLFLPQELIGFGKGMGMLWLAGLEHGARFYAPFYKQQALCRERVKPSPYDD